METRRRSRKQCRIVWDWFDKNQKWRSTSTRMRRTRRRSRPRTVWRTVDSPRKTPTQRKSSSTSSHEDKVEMQDIMRKYKVVKYLDKETWSVHTDLIEMKALKHMTSQAAQDMDDGETRHESRDAEAREHEEVQWTKHASRSDSQAQPYDLTSRGGVQEERVYARCPQHMSNTTNTAQPQGLALCSQCHPVWASEGTPVGPGKNTHGTLGPCKRGGRGWPTTTAQRAKCRTHQTVQNTGLPTNRIAASGDFDHFPQPTAVSGNQHSAASAVPALLTLGSLSGTRKLVRNNEFVPSSFSGARKQVRSNESVVGVQE